MTPPPSTRRQVLMAAAGALSTGCARDPATAFDPTTGPTANAIAAIAAIETRVGGRVGVFARDTGTGREIAYRADDRFPMCSTFKWVLAAAVLARVDRHEVSLDDRVAFGEADMIDHAPVTRARLAEGSLTLEALAHASITVSDNTAANLLLRSIGGPAGFTRFVRAQGDLVTRLDRDEPSLNENEPPRDPRDTTSPRAMVGTMSRILCGDALVPTSRERLLGWLRACETGKTRLRAGMPATWSVGDKSGSGGHGAVNDVAIAWPSPTARGAPILIAAYMCDGASGLAVVIDISARSRVTARMRESRCSMGRIALWMLFATAASACGGTVDADGAGGSGVSSSATGVRAACPDTPPQFGAACDGYCAYEGGVCCPGNVWRPVGACVGGP